jgi:hypothetical protein
MPKELHQLIANNHKTAIIIRRMEFGNNKYTYYIWISIWNFLIKKIFDRIVISKERDKNKKRQIGFHVPPANYDHSATFGRKVKQTIDRGANLFVFIYGDNDKRGRRFLFFFSSSSSIEENKYNTEDRRRMSEKCGVSHLPSLGK